MSCIPHDRERKSRYGISNGGAKWKKGLSSLTFNNSQLRGTIQDLSNNLFHNIQ
jgi:hypothetical protein